MATLDLYVTSGPDDGRGFPASTFSSTQTTLFFGDDGDVQTAYMRFILTSALTGATITSATLTGIFSEAVGVEIDIVADDSSDPDAPTTFGELDGITPTTASVYWNPDPTGGGGSRTSPDISTVIQELVDSYTMANGDAIVIVLDPTAYTNTTVNEIAAYDHASLDPPLLTIVYTSAVTATATALAVTSTFTATADSASTVVSSIQGSVTFDAVTVTADSTEIGVSLAGLVTFPTAVASGNTNATATLTTLAATSTFDAVTATGFDGVVAALTVAAFTAGYPAVTLTATSSATVTVTALAATATFGAVTVYAGVSATATCTILSFTVTFGTATLVNNVNKTKTLTAPKFQAVFPAAMALALELTHFYNTDVTVAVEIAWDDNPLTDPPSWYDVTGLCRGFTITRGRNSELDEYRAGVATITVDNNTGVFDPDNTGGTYYPNVVPMKQVRIRAAYNSQTYILFRGFIERLPMSVQDMTDEVTTITAVDGFKVLNLLKDSTAQSQENAGTRVGHLLDEAGWPNSLRTVATGVVTVPELTPVCASPLSLIRQITDSEAGQFYIGAGGNAVFRNRTYRSTAVSQATFGPASIPYQDIVTDYDDSQIWNRVEVRIGGFPSYSSSTASQDKYGIRQLTVNDILLPNTTDGDDLADIYLARYKDPLQRIESITLRPEHEPSTQWQQALLRDLSDKITVQYVSNAGVTKTLHSYIEGVSHRVTMAKRRTWSTTWQLSQFE